MKINKDFFLKIWRDPVWSKVISVGLLGVIAAIYAFIESIVKDSSFTNSAINVLTMQIKLWHVLVAVIIFVVFYSIRNLYWIKDLTNQEMDRQYVFLSECETELKGFMWIWTWSKVENSSNYKVTDLHPLCPICNGTLTIPDVLGDYECGKCDNEIETQYVPSKSVIKKQIINDLRNKYPDEALFIVS
ncbi:MAG: hypothetical protein RSO15_16395 [Bacteroides sp.]|uniref:hypothetical protein n=1 Tax=Bacteroides sp. TaxID=29523 RepID=UPI002FC7D261